jgi:hypothetical protein
VSLTATPNNRSTPYGPWPRRAERIIAAMAQTTKNYSSTTCLWRKPSSLVDDEKATARRALKEAITIAILPGNKQHQANGDLNARSSNTRRRSLPRP